MERVDEIERRRVEGMGIESGRREEEVEGIRRITNRKVRRREET